MPFFLLTCCFMTKHPVILNEVFDFVCLNLNEDSSPLLAPGSVDLSLLKCCLRGMLARLGVSSWVLNAQRQLGSSCLPQPAFPLCLPRPRGRVRGKVPLSLAWQHRRGRAVSGVQLQHSGHHVVCGMEVLVLPYTRESC